MIRHHRPVPVPRRAGLAGVGLLLAWLGSAGWLPAQFTPGMRINNFSASDPYPPPNYRQMRYVVSGAEGRPQADRTFLLTQLKLQTFRPNGELEMVVAAPECVFNDKARTAGSAGRLTLQSGDGRLRVEGRGFHCRLDTKTLVISNDVTATIVRPNTNAQAAPLVIKARWLEFDAEKRRAVFHDDVRGDDPEFAFQCGTLAVSAANTNAPAFDLIEASESLVVTGKTGGRRAGADRGVYRRAAESIELIGHATWDVDGKSGRADRVLGLRKDGSIRADGQVAMTLPRQAMGAVTGLLSASNMPTAGTSVLEVFADSFHWQSNIITGTGAVRIVDATNGITFSCDALEAKQAASASADETAVATGNVKIERAGGNILAERADYSKRAGTVVFTGHPRWREAQIAGSAGRVTFQTATQAIEAEEEVKVTVSVAGKSGGGSPLAFFPQVATNQTTQTIAITSHRLNVTERRAQFTGAVRAHQTPRTGGEARLSSDRLEVGFARGGGKLEAIIARDNVVYEQGLPGVTNGPAVYRKLTCGELAVRADPATGEPQELVADHGVRVEQPGSVARSARMVYNRPAGLVKLIGQPTVETPQGTYTGRQELEWNLKNSTVSGTDYTVTAGSETLNRLKSAAESQKLPQP